MKRLLSAACWAILATPAAHAAAGMWPLDRLPRQALADHGLRPDVPRLQQATVRLPSGTGSFVSSQGLLLTNHHVVSDCIAALSSEHEPLLQRGFVARNSRDERRCPGMEAEVLVGIDTLPGALPVDAAARKPLLERWTGAECPKAERCEAVLLYGGALVQRYRYRVFNDVRLVFAPEAQAANFGGDDDNFNYPRFAFDFALLRVHEKGRLLRPAHWLRPAKTAPKIGDVVMVTGHPYRTQRLLAVAQLEQERDALLPARIARKQAELQALRAYAQRSAEAGRQTEDPVATLENSLKAMRGELRALHDPALMQAKRSLESRVRAVLPDPAPWERVAAAAQAGAALVTRDEAQALPDASLLQLLVELLTLREERKLPPDERLDAYSAPQEALLRERAETALPLHPDMEAAQLIAHLAHARRQLGEQDAWLQAWPQSPDLEAQLAGWMRLSAFSQTEARLRLLDGQEPSGEPLLELANRLMPLHRQLARELESKATRPLVGPVEAMARARWQALGDEEPPDASFTLRLSFGRNAEVTTAGLRHPWQTNFGGLFARADAFAQRAPFALSPRLAAARKALDPRAPLNFIATADIVGGNSGSPVMNAAGEWIGVAFDGNLDSLAGNYHFDETSNRMVVLHQQAMRMALTQVYAAKHLARELGL